MLKMLQNSNFRIIFALVFHRILDFKAGLDFYLGPFFILYPLCFKQSAAKQMFVSHSI